MEEGMVKRGIFKLSEGIEQFSLLLISDLRIIHHV